MGFTIESYETSLGPRTVKADRYSNVRLHNRYFAVCGFPDAFNEPDDHASSERPAVLAQKTQ
jgi:hypothetical protein